MGRHSKKLVYWRRKKDDVVTATWSGKRTMVIFPAGQAFENGLCSPSRINERCAPLFKPCPSPLLKLWSFMHIQDKARQVSVENPEGYCSDTGTDNNVCSSARLPEHTASQLRGHCWQRVDNYFILVHRQRNRPQSCPELAWFTNRSVFF